MCPNNCTEIHFPLSTILNRIPNATAHITGNTENPCLSGIVKFYVIGRTVVIHENPDDFTSQPAGNAGKKIACGIIKQSVPDTIYMIPESTGTSTVIQSPYQSGKKVEESI